MTFHQFQLRNSGVLEHGIMGQKNKLKMSNDKVQMPNQILMSNDKKERVFALLDFGF
jgi:hypothetical protein